MHNLGLGGMMRRLYDPTQYEYLQPLQPMNEFISWMAFALVATQVLFAGNFIYSLFKGKPAGPNPWKCNTLEWSVPSPPPHGNFAEMPVVYRGPYEYSSPESDEDFLPQWVPPREATTAVAPPESTPVGGES
jgi:cytochrome c oxidase subunit 1